MQERMLARTRSVNDGAPDHELREGSSGLATAEWPQRFQSTEARALREKLAPWGSLSRLTWRVRLYLCLTFLGHYLCAGSGLSSKRTKRMYKTHTLPSSNLPHIPPGHHSCGVQPLSSLPSVHILTLGLYPHLDFPWGSHHSLNLCPYTPNSKGSHLAQA